MPRTCPLWVLVLLCAARLGGHAARVSVGNVARPRNASFGIGRRAAVMLPLLTALPAAAAFDLEPPQRQPRRQEPPVRPSRIPQSAASSSPGPVDRISEFFEGLLQPLLGAQDFFRDFLARQQQQQQPQATQQRKGTMMVPRPGRAAAAARGTREVAPPAAAVAGPCRNTAIYRRNMGNVVVKEIHTRGASSIKQAEFELQAMTQLSGGDIVALLDWQLKLRSTGDVSTFLEMEAADGNLLDALILQDGGSMGKVAFETKLRLLTEILRGVAKLEERGWVHGDISPKSILIFGSCFAQECHAKVGCFGNARPLNAITQPPTPTRLYTAPEVLQGGRDASKMDVWSVGALAYDLLTVNFAFPGTQLVGSAQDVARRDGSVDPRFQELTRYDPQLAELVRRMLVASPDMRPSAAEALQTLTSIVERYGVKVPPQTMRVGTRPLFGGEAKRDRFIRSEEGGSVVKRVIAKSGDDVSRTVNEIEALQKFGGGDIVKLISTSTKTSGGWEARYDLVLEAADGSLDEGLIEKERNLVGDSLGVPFNQKVRILVEILRGVEKMAAAGWAHTDISPENILIFGDAYAPDGCHAKLGDLGGAAPIDKLRGLKTLGAPPHRAPEVWSGSRDMSKIDVYSAGMVAFELFVGSLPEAIEDTARRTLPLDAMAVEFVPLPDEIEADPGFAKLRARDAELAGLVLDMLSPAQGRPSAKQALARAWSVAMRLGVLVPQQ